ncbi:hypothetical protein Dimus_008306 [Dionaea muscipula]
MIWHMAYVISVLHHELPYGDLLTRVFKAFEVPSNDKEGEDPIKTDIFEETFLINNKDAPAENEVEQNEEEVVPEENFEWESVNEDAELQGEPREKEVVADDSGFGEKFYDADEGETTVTEDVLLLQL